MSKKLTITMKDIQYDFIETFAKINGLTKSEAVFNLLFDVAMMFWSNPENWKLKNPSKVKKW